MNKCFSNENMSISNCDVCDISYVINELLENYLENKNLNYRLDFWNKIKKFKLPDSIKATIILILDFLTNVKEYDNLIKSIDEFSDEDIEFFMKIIQNKNTFNIKTVEQLRNYNNIKRKKCDEILENSKRFCCEKENTENFSPDSIQEFLLKKMKEVLLYKTFWHDLNVAKEIVEKYGEDIEFLKESYLQEYVKALKIFVVVT